MSSGLFGATTKEKILHFQADEADEGLEWGLNLDFLIHLDP